MFYVSSIKNNKIGITDTTDGVEEFFLDSEVYNLYKTHKLDIYGTSFYNYKTSPTPISINKTLEVSKLKQLLNDWKKVHNQWTGHPVEDYLASAKVGTRIEVQFITTSSSNRVVNCIYAIKKLDYDNWFFEETEDNVASGQTGSSRFAAWVLEVACIYSNMKGIRITG